MGNVNLWALWVVVDGRGGMVEQQQQKSIPRERVSEIRPAEEKHIYLT